MSTDLEKAIEKGKYAALPLRAAVRQIEKSRAQEYKEKASATVTCCASEFCIAGNCSC